MAKALAFIMLMLLVACIRSRSLFPNTPLPDPSQGCVAFKRGLSEYINNGSISIGYNDIWTAFRSTDSVWPRCDGKLADVFSSKCWEMGTEQCGNYKTEVRNLFDREFSLLPVFTFLIRFLG